MIARSSSGAGQGWGCGIPCGFELGGRAFAGLLDFLGQLPGAKLPHGQELEDPVFDILETVVVFIQDPGGMVQLELIVGAGVPGKLGDPLEIGADDLGLHGLPPGAFQAAELALHLDASRPWEDPAC